ncbi:MAG: rhodanese-like domain-containing protein [Sulfitobacter sp.]
MTVGETDVLTFLMDEVAGDKGLMVDARMPADRASGYIPGTVSLPFPTLDAESEFKGDILRVLGARELDGVFNFSDARELLVYDKGPSADDAGQLIKNLLTEGYPREKIRYYRGGMQVWSVLGFSIAEGTS